MKVADILKEIFGIAELTTCQQAEFSSAMFYWLQDKKTGDYTLVTSAQITPKHIFCFDLVTNVTRVYDTQYYNFFAAPTIHQIIAALPKVIFKTSQGFAKTQPDDYEYFCQFKIEYLPIGKWQCGYTFSDIYAYFNVDKVLAEALLRTYIQIKNESHAY